MSQQQFSSSLLEDAIHQFAKLPGIGRKTALRLVLHLLKESEEEVENFGNSIIRLRKEILYCKICHNISDSDICDICSNLSRDRSVVCVVENIKDVITIENTQQFRGLYHVLGGIISPMDGVGPKDLEIDSLLQRVENDGIKEVILALSTTMEGDTTNFYLYRKLEPFHVKITTLARGVSIGDELEYADEITLGRSIQNRIEFSQTFNK
ncbi:MAG: recombination protein RecR [Paludibacteraceae bacterium]|jgi:recombination protein RecR|nr:recombination protein RecR [Paludibacteraceae bacterium]OPZ01886.1 MAG: Recombination protein RecR [Bacteroidetes bacterium ADurb.BinA395]MBP8966494.1 recombination protein RecR [Paludibacteraceae bacterium]HOF99244.1 recombination mediator RecR [Paludibacteraceae bacterium]HOR39219.1 recombination mediator RecR [Paludibacteraceae bacterium]